nr:transposase [Heliomicrobium undosum]
MGQTGKRYSAEFKADTIRMIKENGRSIISVAKDLGVSEQTVYRRKKSRKIPTKSV